MWTAPYFKPKQMKNTGDDDKISAEKLSIEEDDLGLIVDENIETTCAEDEVGTNQLCGRLAGVDDCSIVELRLRKTRPIIISVNGSRTSRSSLASILQISIDITHTTAAAAAAAADSVGDVTMTQAAARCNARAN